MTVLNISLNSFTAQAHSNKTALKSTSKISVFREARDRSSISNSTAEKPMVLEREQTVIADTFSGRASWYGPNFHGRRTANGEVFNQNALTAAHPYLKFGTKVKVTNLHNGRSVVVRINDRGPFAGGRVIDLSAAAARVIEMVRTGIAPVRVTILGR